MTTTNQLIQAVAFDSPATHQGIADRILAMNSEAHRVYEEFRLTQAPELQKLRAQCAQIGHIFTREFLGAFFRKCAACGCTEEINAGEKT